MEREGVRTSKRFATKSATELWAVEQEASLANSSGKAVFDKTVTDAVDRYIRDVTAKKATARQERMRLEAFLRNFPLLANKLLADVSAADCVDWRDARLRQVSPASVRREMSAIAHMFKLAGREWGWMQWESPWADVSRPKDSLPRQRRITPLEVKRIVRAMGYVSNKAPDSKTAEIAWAFMVSLHTAMRSSEILELRRDTASLRQRVVTLASH